MDESKKAFDRENVLGKIIPIVFILLIILGVVLATQKTESNEIEEVSVATPTPTETLTTTPVIANYKDGIYKVEGDYRSPAGPESINVKLTLKNNLVTVAEVTSNATVPNSVKFQGLFISGYKEFVIGKDINQIKLDKVSGSSLTPKGFNDAIEKIKAEAKV